MRLIKYSIQDIFMSTLEEKERQILQNLSKQVEEKKISAEDAEKIKRLLSEYKATYNLYAGALDAARKHPLVLSNSGEPVLDHKQVSRLLPEIIAYTNAKEFAPSPVNILPFGRLEEAVDPTTKGHSLRLAGLLWSFISFLDVSEKQKEELKATALYGAAIHDIGKIRSMHLVNKPGKLTQEEYEIVKRHVLDGIEILREEFPSLKAWHEKPILRFLFKPFLPYLLKSKRFRKWTYKPIYTDPIFQSFNHHEAYDGSGYAFGLKGDEIPLVARILKLIDVSEALSGKERAFYRLPMSFASTLELILRSSGTIKKEDIDPSELYAKVDKIAPGLVAEVKAKAQERREEIEKLAKEGKQVDNYFTQEEAEKWHAALRDKNPELARAFFRKVIALGPLTSDIELLYSKVKAANPEMAQEFYKTVAERDAANAKFSPEEIESWRDKFKTIDENLANRFYFRYQVVFDPKLADLYYQKFPEILDASLKQLEEVYKYQREYLGIEDPLYTPEFLAETKRDFKRWKREARILFER